jgi:hypothetical protein
MLAFSYIRGFDSAPAGGVVLSFGVTEPHYGGDDFALSVQTCQVIGQPCSLLIA